MNTRIRYKESAVPGVYESVQKFLTKDGGLFTATIDTNRKVYSVGGVYHAYTNVHAAKMSIKKELKEYGVVFTDEVRRKKDKI